MARPEHRKQALLLRHLVAGTLGIMSLGEERDS